MASTGFASTVRLAKSSSKMWTPIFQENAQNLSTALEEYINQLQDFIDHGYLSGSPDVATIDALPDWEDTSYTLEERGRAYFDVNCAHCHTAGGFCEIESTLRLDYETPFAESKILERQNQIVNRMQYYNAGFSMPFIGTTIVHTEGFNLIKAYIDSLD